MDTVCLRPFDFQASQVFSSEMHHGTPVVNCGMIKTPPGSAFSEYTWRVCESKDPQRLVRGETGPRLAAEAVNALGLHPCVVGPATFCPVDPDYWKKSSTPTAAKSSRRKRTPFTFGTKYWRFEGLDKDAELLARLSL